MAISRLLCLFSTKLIQIHIYTSRENHGWTERVICFLNNPLNLQLFLISTSVPTTHLWTVVMMVRPLVFSCCSSALKRIFRVLSRYLWGSSNRMTCGSPNRAILSWRAFLSHGLQEKTDRWSVKMLADRQLVSYDRQTTYRHDITRENADITL